MFWLFEIGIVKSYEDYLTEKTFLEKWISYCESAFNPLFLAKFTEMMYLLSSQCYLPQFSLISVSTCKWKNKLPSS